MMKRKSFNTNEIKRWRIIDIGVISCLILYNLLFTNGDWGSLYVGANKLIDYVIASISLIFLLLFSIFPFWLFILVLDIL